LLTLSGAARNPAMHEGHRFGNRFEVERPVEGAIAAADDNHVVAAESLDLAHSIVNADALIELDFRHGRALGLEGTATSRDDDDLGDENLVRIGLDAETSVFQLLKCGDHGRKMELRIERCDLLQEIGGEILSGDFGQTGNIIDRLFRIKLGALAAGTIENIDHMGAQIEQTKLEHGKEADRAGADNNHICFNQFGHKGAF
jgi:hypothetical protein